MRFLYARGKCRYCK